MPARLGCRSGDQTQSDAPLPTHTRIALRDVTASFMRMRRQVRSRNPAPYSKHAGRPPSASSIRPRKDKPSAQVNLESTRLGFFARGKPSGQGNSRSSASRYRPREADSAWVRVATFTSRSTTNAPETSRGPAVPHPADAACHERRCGV